jgi:hypothetical protein
MKNLTIGFAILFLYSCKPICERQSFSIANTQIPNFSAFNPLGKVRNDTLYLLNRGDTIRRIVIDSIGRVVSERQEKWFSEEVSYQYLFGLNIPTMKKYRTDYPQWFESYSFLKNDTLIQVWYDGFPAIVDTFTYIFDKDNRLKCLFYGNLNSEAPCKAKKVFYYKEGNLQKAVITPVWGNLHIFKTDSIILDYSYSKENNLLQLTENYYFHERGRNYKTTTSYNSMGYPIKQIFKDTMDINIIF